MTNVYLFLRRSVAIVMLFLGHAAFAQPVINSFSPTSAWPGLPLTINGSGFSSVATGNIVYFGPVRATVQAATTNTLNVTVPVGATYAPITVTVNGLTGYSRLPFNVTFQNQNTTLDTNDFGSRKDVYGFSNPRSVTFADFDRDGRADLFVANQSANTVAVLRNTSAPQTISFAAAKIFPGGPAAYGSAAGDFDGDGKVDIAVANTHNGSGGSVMVYRNSSINDTIIFDTTRYATANLTTRVAIEDIDRDGKPDLLAVSHNSNVISVFRNTTTTPGYITFEPKINLMTGAGPRDLAIADIDGDGKPDLVSLASGVGPGVSIWRNLSTPGAISFAVRVHISTVVGPTTLRVGDLNEDGKLDIVVASISGGNISTFRNRSTVGSFSFDTRQDITTGGIPQRVSIADLNGDSRPDVAVSFDTAKAIYVYPGIAGDSIALGNRVEYKTGLFVSDIAVGDVDGDGEVDLAFGNSITGGFAVTVLRNRQNGETPVINSFTPTSAATGTFVSIYGKNLSTTGAVKFGTAWSDSVQVVNDSLVKARVNNGSTGNITLFTLYGVATKSGFTYIGDTTNVPDTLCPVITSFWPTSGQQGTAVYILGSNFTGSSGVRFGGVPADSIVILSDTMIKAIVDTGATGTVQVISPNCWASKPGFTFIQDTTNVPDTIPAPIITSFTPSIGQTGTIVTIVGRYFTGATVVTFGGVNADSIVVLSDTVIQARVGAGASGTVAVTTPHGTGYKSYFNYYTPPVNIPIIGYFNPTGAYRGTPVYIRGVHFTGTTAVRFGGINADSFVVLSDTIIKAIVDTGASGVVSVVTPLGIANKSGFTYLGDSTNIPDSTSPVIINFWPQSGEQGTIVQVLGNNLGNTIAVRFGGVPADSTWVTSDTTVRAIVGSGATGSVSVTTPFGTASKPGFTYISDTTINDTLFVNTRTTGANGIVQQRSFKLYPNPASNVAIWQQPIINHKTRLQLVDMAGRIVRQMEVGSNTSQTTIQLHELKAGMYKLVYIDGKSKITSALLVK